MFYPLLILFGTKLEKMNKEILGMKQQRVRLMKQIKEESENFRKWKMEQDKKLMQLKAKDRKREVSFIISIYVIMLDM